MIQGLGDFKAYNLALEIGERVWASVKGWDYFAKDTIGKQLIRSVDSIASNLAEGLGRYHTKEIKNFAYYSRGSLFETKTWLTKAAARSLYDAEEFQYLVDQLDVLGRMINSYIRSLGNVVNEPEVDYHPILRPIPNQHPTPNT